MFEKIHMYVFNAHCECILLIKVTVNISRIDNRLKTSYFDITLRMNKVICASAKYSKETALKKEKNISEIIISFSKKSFYVKS